MNERFPTEAEAKELASLGRAGRRLVGKHVKFTGRPKTPDIVRALRETIDIVRGTLKADKMETAAYKLGTLWGEQVRKAHKWEWLHLTADNGFGGWGIASPNRAYVALPHHFFYNLLCSNTHSNNSALTFALITAGELPATEPRQYLVIAGGGSNEEDSAEAAFANEADRLFKRAEKLYYKGHYREGIKAYQALLKVDSAHAAGWNDLGILHSTFDEISDALRCYDRAIAIDPNRLEFWRSKSLTLSQLDLSQRPHMSHLAKYKDAYQPYYESVDAMRRAYIECIEAMIRLGSDKDEGHDRLASLYESLGDINASAEAWLQSITHTASEKRSNRRRFSLGLLYEKVGRYADALDQMRPYIASRGKLLLVHEARLLTKMGRSAEAQAVYQEMLTASEQRLQERPTESFALHQKGDALIGLGQTKAAATFWEETLRREDISADNKRRYQKELDKLR